MCSLYRLGDRLYLPISEQSFETSDEVDARLIRGNQDKHVFQLLGNGYQLLGCTYSPPPLDVPSAEDPTPMVEEEDFDFLLLVTSVLNDRGRRQRNFNQASQRSELTCPFTAPVTDP